MDVDASPIPMRNAHGDDKYTNAASMNRLCLKYVEQSPHGFEWSGTYKNTVWRF